MNESNFESLLEMHGFQSPGSIASEEEIERVRLSLPRFKAGNPLQAYKWALSQRLRQIRMSRIGKIPSSIAKQLIANAGVCEECGHSIEFSDGRMVPSIDHIRPVSKGGDNSPSNLRVICNRCNSGKRGRA